jgi:PPM family protein phosphatase
MTILFSRGVNLATARVAFAAGRASQDRSAILVLPDRAVIVLADGAGGTTGGAEAAEATVDLMLHELAHGAALSDPQILADMLVTFDSRLARERHGGQTTAVVVIVTRDSIIGASVGDSEAHLYAVTGGHDLTANQERKPLLGSGRARPRSFALESIGTLLVASDGLFAYADQSRLAELVHGADLGAAAFALAEHVRLPTQRFRDDVTIILAR